MKRSYVLLETEAGWVAVVDQGGWSWRDVDPCRDEHRPLPWPCRPDPVTAIADARHRLAQHLYDEANAVEAKARERANEIRARAAEGGS